MGILQEEYATARGPLIKILQPVSFMLFQITDTEQKGETARSLTSHKLETVSYVQQDYICLEK